jgi:hypothetical protein
MRILGFDPNFYIQPYVEICQREERIWIGAMMPLRPPWREVIEMSEKNYERGEIATRGMI